MQESSWRKKFPSTTLRNKDRDSTQISFFNKKNIILKIRMDNHQNTIKMVTKYSKRQLKIKKILKKQTNNKINQHTLQTKESLQ